MIVQGRKALSMSLHQGMIEIAYIVLPLLALQWLLTPEIERGLR